MNIGIANSLHLRDTGDDVETLQLYLKKGGFYKGAINGTYDASTLTAVAAWQAANNLPETGEIEQAELDIINAAASANTASVPAVLPASPGAPAQNPGSGNNQTPPPPSSGNNVPPNNGQNNNSGRRRMSSWRKGILAIAIVGGFLLLVLVGYYFATRGNDGKNPTTSSDAQTTVSPSPTASATVTPAATSAPTAAPTSAPADTHSSGGNGYVAPTQKPEPTKPPKPTQKPEPTSAPVATVKAPSASTGGASAIGKKSATVSGTVNPNGAATTCWIEYGRSTSDLRSTAAQSVGNGKTAKSMSFGLTGLEPGTVYKYRIVSDNSKGTVNGEFKSFTTDAASPEPTVTPEPTSGFTADDININVTMSGGLLKITASPASGKSFPQGTKYGVYLNGSFYDLQGWVEWNNAGNSIKLDYPGGTVQVKIAVQLPNGSIVNSRTCQYPQ